MDAFVREVEFSYNELLEVMNMLNYLIVDSLYHLPAAANVRSWYVDVIGNRVVIEFADYSEAAVDLFRATIFDSPVLVFAESIGSFEIPAPTYDEYSFDLYSEFYFDEDYEMDGYDVYGEYESISPASIVTVWAGDPIRVIRNGTVITGGLGVSAGYRATIGTRHGFITTAHQSNSPSGSIQAGDFILNSANQRIGRVVNSFDVRLSGIDAAFIQLESGVTFDTWLPNAPIINTSNTPPIFVGQVVSSIGQASGHRSGFVISTHYSTSLGTHTVTNTVRASYISQPGDSGGIVYTWGNTIGILGIHVGGLYEFGVNSIFSRTDEILRVLGARAQ
jgi:hypothetical protein